MQTITDTGESVTPRRDKNEWYFVNEMMGDFEY